jgi:hypothetical protein
MKYCGDEKNLPKETLDSIACNSNTCPKITRKHEGEIWQRVPQEPSIVTNGVATLAAKQEQRKTRSRAHFKNEILPKMKDKASKRHFDKKFKGTKKIDHTKM